MSEKAICGLCGRPGSVQAYVVVEPQPGSERFRKCDVFVCPWSDLGNMLALYLEENEAATLKFTVKEWTEGELEAWCREQDVEWGEPM